MRLNSSDPDGTRVGSDQDFHTDDYSHAPGAQHFPRWVVAFYYPAVTTVRAAQLGRRTIEAGLQSVAV